MKRIALALLLFLPLAACTSNLAGSARDTAAALNGVIVAAQAQNQSCVTNPTAATCTLITKGIAAENALITATETYCGWSTTNPPAAGAVCVPVASGEALLTASIANATLFITEIKGVLK